MKPAVRTLGVVLALALAFSAPSLAAEGDTGLANATPEEIIEVAPVYEGGESLVPEAYGTATQSVYTVRIQDFATSNNTVTYSTVNTGGIYVYQTSTSTIEWWGRVYVPNGALIDRIEMQACDTTATGQILWGLASMDAPAQTGTNVTSVGGTGAATTPGCAFFSLTPLSTLQVDNRNKSYLLFVGWQGDFSSANKVAAFRVFYRLQVSAGPATATFTDVPTTSGQFNYVEALYAAGITSGCATGLYCPDTPITRGQMAVFLSRALGLHWPN